MNTKLIALLVVVVALIAGVVAYVAGHQPPPGGNSPQAAQTAPTEKTVEDTTDFYTIKAVYPVEPFDKEGVMQRFVALQVEAKKGEWKTGGDAYTQEKDVEKQFPDRPKMTYTLDIGYKKFSSAARGTVSYVFTIGTYTGGANGDEKVQTFTFDKNGAVSLESVLNIAGYGAGTGNKKMGNDIELSNLLLKKASADTDTFPDISMAKDGLGLSYLKADGVTLDHAKCKCDGWFYGSNLQNFAITDEGMTFYFSKYAIAPGASGIVGLTLDWAQLQPYLVSASSTNPAP